MKLAGMGPENIVFKSALDGSGEFDKRSLFGIPGIDSEFDCLSPFEGIILDYPLPQWPAPEDAGFNFHAGIRCVIPDF